MTDSERELTCTRCRRTITLVGAAWIDADLYECQTCRAEGPGQATLLDPEKTEPVREDWHDRYDPWIAEIPF